MARKWVDSVSSLLKGKASPPPEKSEETHASAAAEEAVETAGEEEQPETIKETGGETAGAAKAGEEADARPEPEPEAEATEPPPAVELETAGSEQPVAGAGEDGETRDGREELSISIEEKVEAADMYGDNSEVTAMTLDLESLQKGLRKKLDQLEKERLAIEERLSAVDLVIRTSEEMGDLSGLGETETEEKSSKKNEGDSGKEASEKDQPKREKPTFELSEEDAILEILKTFQRPLDAKSIVNELSAVGYPFENGNPVDSIDNTLKDLARDGKVSKMKGNLFAIV